jgi:seryl-tRNA synthetase
MKRWMAWWSIKSILNELKLPYRVLRLCGGDMGFTSALTYDFEVFSTAQDRWLEISSVSNFETFQANRLKLRLKTRTVKSIGTHQTEVLFRQFWLEY